MSAQRIYQDLREVHGFQGSYDSVKRYVRAHGGRVGPRVYRVECEPGQEAQVDFGSGAWIVSEGRRRRSWVLRVVLSHSRKGYSEAVFQQTTEDFIRALENAFWHFGGVPLTLITDNLKAAVKHLEWYDPELTPKVAAFCKHYGAVILPTRVRTPRHNGKVERGVGYVKGNALKGRHFETLGAENAYLIRWEEHVADQRIHGTTRRHVGLREATYPPPLGELTPSVHPVEQAVDLFHILLIERYGSAAARSDVRSSRWLAHSHQFFTLKVIPRSETIGKTMSAFPFQVYVIVSLTICV